MRINRFHLTDGQALVDVGPHVSTDPFAKRVSCRGYWRVEGGSCDLACATQVYSIGRHQVPVGVTAFDRIDWRIGDFSTLR